MANIREIQSRIQSIRDTMKITNAMYMISTTKYRKAKKGLEETEPYFYSLQSLVTRILRHIPDIESFYFDQREKKKPEERTTGYVVVTSDKGLAGAYNHNVMKLAQEQMEQVGRSKLFVVGEVGRHYYTSKQVPIEEEFRYTAQNPTLHRSRVISGTLIEQFQSGELDEVYMIYTNMLTSISTEARIVKLLPLEREDYLIEKLDLDKAGIYQEEFSMHPSPTAVINNILPGCLMGYVYGALVESFCCEQDVRMMAMEAANKNGADMIRELSIIYNRVRQAMITQEITEVISGAKAQKKKKERRLVQ